MGQSYSPAPREEEIKPSVSCTTWPGFSSTYQSYGFGLGWGMWNLELMTRQRESSRWSELYSSVDLTIGKLSWIPQQVQIITRVVKRGKGRQKKTRELAK